VAGGGLVAEMGRSMLRPYIAAGSLRWRGLGAIGGVDADVFGGEVASPVAGAFAAGVEIQEDGDVFG